MNRQIGFYINRSLVAISLDLSAGPSLCITGIHSTSFPISDDTMASILLSPTSAHFNALPSIEDSNSVMQERCTDETLSRLCNIFLKHKVHQTFGFALVHQHFELREDEKLVNCGNVAVPVREGSIMDSVAATGWAFDREKIIPYEFSTEAAHIDMNQHHEFLNEFRNLLDSHGLSKHIGLCTLDSIADASNGPTMEFTSGRANITLPFDLEPSIGASVEASWQVHEGMFFTCLFFDVAK